VDFGSGTSCVIGGGMSARRNWVRTCVGCRRRAPASELLRVVACEVILAGEPPGGDGPRTSGPRFDIVPDPARRRPGPGPHLRVEPACPDQAVRRRAFGRALRVSGVAETDAITTYLRTLADGGTAPTDGPDSEAGSPDAQGRTTTMATR